LAMMATATASRPAERPWRWAARRATGMATTTATSRLTSALSSAVNARTAATEVVLPRAGMTARARIPNAPSRSASAEARMIAARVANGPAVALAAAAEASGRSAAAMTATRAPAAHMPIRRGSRVDVILADSLVLLDVMSRIFPPCLDKISARSQSWAGATMEPMLHDDVRL
jgi:hypothetical protein